MSKSLISFDTDRIKNYVFATDTLKEIRGASHLLDYLNREKMKNIVGGTCYYAHGGSGLFCIETDRVNDVIQQVQRMYREQTGGAASITGVAVELPNGFDENHDNVQLLWKLLGYRLKAEKARNQEYITTVTHPLLHFGESDGNFYATDIASAIDADEGQYLISRVSRLKQKENIRVKIKNYQAGRAQPERFDDIAKASTPQNYFALMVADGDGLGQVLDKCDTLPQIAALATCIHETLTTLVKQVAEQLGIEEKQHDVLLLGGDDLVVALPADKALAFAMQVTEQFTDQMKCALQGSGILPSNIVNKPFTLSTAVVWAHTKFPFGAWHSIAESVLKFAKTERAKRLQKDPNNTKPLINFLVISSANHLDFSDYYGNVFTYNIGDDPRTGSKQKVVRTMRPYTVADLQRLVDYRQKALRSMPRSKLESLRKAVFQSSLHQAMLDSLRVLVHWRGGKTREAVRNLLLESTTNNADILRSFPFVRTESPDPFDDEETIITYRTPLADLAELWDFIPPGEAKQGGSTS